MSAESVAIVSSILLAFAIEAWWQDRNELAIEQRSLSALLAEFEQLVGRLISSQSTHLESGANDNP